MTDALDRVTRRSTVLRSDAEWFDATYPAYGSWTWFVEAALTSFREQHTVTPQDMIDIATAHIREDASDD